MNVIFTLSPLFGNYYNCAHCGALLIDNQLTNLLHPKEFISEIPWKKPIPYNCKYVGKRFLKPTLKLEELT